jgi:DNA-binding transcriptional ArsR family regulator
LKIMRPLLHPATEEIRAEAVLHALADPVRASIFAGIAGADCAMSCSAAASDQTQPIAKSSLSQHFRVLREAGLIHSERHGVEMRNTSRCREVDARFPGLLEAVLSAYRVQGAGR